MSSIYKWDGKNRNVTSLEQSKRLAELGLGMESADYVYATNQDFVPKPEHIVSGGIPAWSLSRLLEIMPETISSEEYKTIRGRKIEYYLASWTINSYMYENDIDDVWVDENTPKRLVYVTGESWLEAAVNLMCWLIENKYYVIPS